MPDPPDQPPLPAGPPIVVTVTDIADKEIDPKQEEKLRAVGRKEAGEPQGWWGALWASIIDGFLWLLSGFVGLADKFFALIAKAFLTAQGEKNPEFYELTAALITDLTGVRVDGSKLIEAFQQRGRVSAMREVGGGLFDVLSGEFAGVEQEATVEGFTEPKGDGIGGLPVKELSAQQGVNAARAFLGFAMSFAVREGNTDMLAEIIPSFMGYAPARAFKDFAEDFSKSLGIGRLLRLVMRPLINTMVGIPLQWALNEQYRPTHLGAAESIRAFFRTTIKGEQLDKDLAQLGFSQDRIQELIEQARPLLEVNTLRKAFNRGDLTRDQFNSRLQDRGFTPDQVDILFQEGASQLSESDIFTLFRAGVFTGDEARGRLIKLGWRLEEVELNVKADILRRLEPIAQNTISIAEKAVLDGTMDLIEFSDLLQGLPLYEDERTGIATMMGKKLALRRRPLTLAEMRKAFIDGIIDLSEWLEFLQRVGFTTSDAQILTQQLLLDIGKRAEAEKLKEERAAAKAAKTATPPPTP